MTTKSQNKNSASSSNGNLSKGQKLGREATSGAVLGECVTFSKTLNKTLDQGVGDILEQAERYKNNPAASQAGFVAEADHCATFNARKALERDGTRAVRQPNGNHGDYKIVKGDKVLVEGEVKYHATAEKTETAMRGYGDQQLVGPADQADEIQKIAERKAATNGASDKPARQQVAREHEKVAENAGNSITDGKTKSTPRTRKEAEKIADDASKGKLDHDTVLPPMGESLKLAAKSGAKSGAIGGAVFGGGVSILSNTKAYLDGDKDGAEALVDVSVDVAKSAGDGALKGATSSAATAAAKHAATKVASPMAKTLLRSSAPAAIAIGLVETAKHGVDLARGEIDGEEFAEAAAKTAATTAGGWAGAELGATLGAPLGPAGILIGMIGGGVLGALGAESWFD